MRASRRAPTEGAPWRFRGSWKAPARPKDHVRYANAVYGVIGQSCASVTTIFSTVSKPGRGLPSITPAEPPNRRLPFRFSSSGLAFVQQLATL